ncbi:DUF4097 family beta strand repeat-containing protein [Mucilaginibacter auburnensis]|uniref:Adhesin n=1 Tax=Mucilaginibacter auburnensis TaxID=1457233 RepID=A0A2H9VVR7_9SPHI|nr:hypothetical protein [Mucilaginibacter auburnensis]PJJ84911.1 hypothetical protein CLV57_1933 [Mucilaginibacter auburnensis]
MKKLITFLLAISVSVIARAQSDNTPYLTKSFNPVGIQNVIARTSGGSISVTGNTGSEARVEVYIKGQGNKNLSKADIDEKLKDDYTLDISTTGNKLNAIATQKNKMFNWSNGLSVSFKIYVPKNVSTNLNTSGGSISMNDLNGNHDFSTSGGSLNLNLLTGNINGRTSGGSITVNNSKNQIKLNTSGGSIKAQNCSGNISLSTSGGSLSLNDLNGTVEANTSGGSVNAMNIIGELITHTSGGSMALQNISGSLNASTSGGSMNVGITKLGKYITLDNSGGGVNLKLPNQGMNLNMRANRVKVNQLSNFNGDKDDDKLDGTVNGGGVPVKVRTSGSIKVDFI